MRHNAKINSAEQSSAPAARAGAFALCLDLQPVKSEAPRLRAFGVALLVLLLAAIAAAPEALGDGRIEGVSDSSGIAVSKQTGDLYLNAPSGQRVVELHSDGTFVRAFGWGVATGAAELQTCTSSCHQGIEGSGPGQFRWSDEIAVDNDETSPSYGDVYVVDQRNFRIEKFDPEGHLLLMFGGEVDKGPHHPGNVCTAGYLAEGDSCGAGASGTGPGFFEQISSYQSWSRDGSASIAIGPEGTVYVGDFGRIQEFEPDGSYKGELTLPEQQFISSVAVASGGVYALSRPVSEFQLVNPPGSGEYTLTFKGQTTSPLAFNANEITVQNSLSALSTVGPGNVHVEKFGSALFIQFTGALAHTNVPQMTASSGSVETLLEGATGELVKLGPAGEVLQTLDPSGEPTHLALDESGNLFVSDLNGAELNPPNGEPEFRGYRPDGTFYAEFSSDQVGVPGGGAHGVAVGNAAGKLYATSYQPGGDHIAVIPLPEPGPPVVVGGSEHAADVEAGTASLHAVVNPKGFDTHYRFEYIDQHDFESGGFSNPAVKKTSLTDIGLLIHDQPVVVAISGLTHDTKYHFRAVAENAEGEVQGEDATFTTLPPVSIRELTTQTVGPELVTLKAQINPNNAATTYTFHYGESQSYLGGSSSGALPIGHEFEERTVTFTNLKPNTTYHYQLMAENETGKVETGDQTFKTEPSSSEEREAESCGNTTLREENDSLSLPDCRAYEMVSPPNKANNDVDGLKFQLAPSGERVRFSSQGVFAGTLKKRSGVQYVSQRTPAGWVTESTYAHLPPGASQQLGDPQDFSANLDAWAGHLGSGLNWQDGERPISESIYLGTSSGFFQQVSPTYRRPGGGILSAGSPFLAQSADLSHIVIGTPYRLLPSEDPLPEVITTPSNLRLYEISGAGGPEPKMKLAVEIPAGLNAARGCEIDPAYGNVMAQNLNNLSADGSTLFYAGPLELAPGKECEAGLPGPNKFALFARTGEAPPIQISSPPNSQCEASSPCDSAAPQNVHFYGASADATRAWFTTTQPLVDSDTDQTESSKSNDLYLARLQGGQLTELVQVSRGEATDPHRGEGAGLQGLLRLSQDASHAFFVATAVLTTQPNSNGASQGEAAAEGADNLYAYDSESGETKFVARLCSGPGESGSSPDPACGSNLQSVEQELNDSRLWDGRALNSDATPNGRYLLFRSFANLTPDDTDNAADLYRYDFSTGQLTRVSIGRRGNDGDGSDNAFNANFAHHAFSSILPFAESGAGDESRAISADGSTAIFTTEAPLVSQDTNEAPDLYQWEEQGHGSCTEPGGCVSLVSPGVDPHGTIEGLIGESGEDIAFITNRSLFPADVDGLRDVYDARVEGGFHVPPTPEICHSADTCHEKGTEQSSPPNFTSEQTRSGGNGRQPIECAKGRHRVKKHGQWRCVPNKPHKHKRRMHHKRGRANQGGHK